MCQGARKLTLDERTEPIWPSKRAYTFGRRNESTRDVFTVRMPRRDVREQLAQLASDYHDQHCASTRAGIRPSDLQVLDNQIDDIAPWTLDSLAVIFESSQRANQSIEDVFLAFACQGY